MISSCLVLLRQFCGIFPTRRRQRPGSTSPAPQRTAPAPLFVPALVAIALFAVACSSGSDGPSTGTGNAGTGGASTGGSGVDGGAGGGGTTGDGGRGGGAAAGGAGLGGGSGTGGVGGSSGATGGGSGGRGGAAGATSAGGRGGTSSGGGRGGASGAAGSAGIAGQGGAGAAGAGGGTTTVPKPSAGCGMAATQALNQWVAGTLTVSGTSRTTAVRLPTGYDPTRAYPVIVLLHGCGGGTNNVPMENATGSNAILVRGTGSASGTCWTTTASGADVAFVDAMVADVKARFCTDEGRFFTVGYSSGSWLVNQLTCIRAGALRGAATVTGGEAASGTCGGPVARMFVHDKDDTDNVISGSERARDRQLTQNGCDKSMAPVATDPSPCVRYPGCPAAYPVVWCATSGQKHNRQDNWVPAAFWNFFKAF